MVSAKNDVPPRRGDDSILPIASELPSPRGGTAWIAAGVCALAFSVLFSVKVKPVEPSAPVEPAWAAAPPAAATQPATAVPPAAKEDDVNKVLEQAMPLVISAAQAEPVTDANAPGAAPQAQPPQPAAPAAPVQSAWALRKARREARQRAGHEFTLALNLAGVTEQASPQPAPSPVAAPASAPAEAAPAPEPVVTQVAAVPKSPIPDNPY